MLLGSLEQGGHTCHSLVEIGRCLGGRFALPDDLPV
jgi:hypothetical protein